MAKLLFKLKGVFDDEADDVRALLTENQIDFYESPAGNWGISVHAIWLNNDEQYTQARALIDEYQQQRSQRLQQENQLRREQGETETLWQRFLHNPLQFLLYAAFILFLLYISVMPFLNFGN